MAKQKGPIKIEGTLGDISFYKQNGKHFVRNKGGVSADRIKKDPRFARTRENLAEFGAANKGAKLIRKGVRLGMQKVRDPRLNNRLMPLVMKVLQADTTHVRGERTIASGDLSLLENFQFSNKVNFDSIYFLSPLVAVDKTAGTVTIDWPDYTTEIDLVTQVDATHFRLFSLVATIDFDEGSAIGTIVSSAEISQVSALQSGFTDTHTIEAGTNAPVFVLLGVEYLQELNGVYYPLRNGSLNPMEIYHIET